jgi:hypothetical protein
MTAGTYLKIGLALLVTVGGLREWSNYKDGLRLEGEVRVLRENLRPALDSLEALRVRRSHDDSVRASAVARAAQEAAQARQDAQEAETEAQAARRDRDLVRSSVIEEYGDTVRAAVARVEEAADREVARVQQVAALRAAEAASWQAAFTEEQARRIDAEELLASEAQVSEARARIIETLEARVDRKGHGLLVDVALAAGGAVVGGVACSLAGC